MISKRFKNDLQPTLRVNDIQLEAKKVVEEKIKNGTYKTEVVSCPICNSSETDLLSEKDRYGLSYRVVVCKGCGLVRTNPRMTQESYNEFYDQEYRKLYGGREEPTDSVFFNQCGKGKKIYEFIAETIPGTNFKELQVLEVGCGAGGILFYFKGKGCCVKGVDLGSEYLEFGKCNYNLDLTHGSLKDIPKEFKPDIVIYSRVLEHILDVNAELKNLYERCHEKTLVYIEVPGIRNIHYKYKMNSLLYFQNAHTFHFTLSSLNNLLIKNDFKLVYGTEYVRSIFSITETSTYKREIVNEYPWIVYYFRKLERFRFLSAFVRLFRLRSNNRLSKNPVSGI